MGGGAAATTAEVEAAAVADVDILDGSEALFISRSEINEFSPLLTPFSARY